LVSRNLFPSVISTGFKTLSITMKQLSILIISIVLLSSNNYNYDSSKGSIPLQINSLLNKKAPHFIGYLLNDSIVDETFLANKVVLLNFMFIGCKGCMQELPNLQRINEKYKNSDFIIMTIMGNGIPDIKSYLGIGDTSNVFYLLRKTFKYESINNIIIAECKSAKKNGGPNSLSYCHDNISKPFLVDAYPTNMLIDKTGTIRKIYPNIFDDNIYQDLQKGIDNLLEIN
jgi:thiol-disulfide isomerase/thioredoxin